MIQIHRPGHYLDIDALDKQFREQAYKQYVLEQRELPTQELQRRVINYEEKSIVGKFLFRIFSDESALLRVKAARQILKERNLILQERVMEML